ncbi:hypothetical protein AZI86_12455 [Bdellovibrio bacteriovorus]|uniref:BON domain-containing protein n=1 Tax=Bdellovibrio bacteriovorus TaxID=959 RepID=A0A150WIV0_BDEBC|nr:BON domain-containing protein [Bdellovibrio bacteriovorus]KYG63636.1 hypothetical protein AZI86_12455 [Bdellovibrio bacteriovorus]
MIKRLIIIFSLTLSSVGFAKTAEDQGRNARDTELTRSIREQIVADQNLSMRAKNITIISKNGLVTLKGAVATNQEQSRVEEIAKKSSGTKSVVNQTEVSTNY